MKIIAFFTLLLVLQFAQADIAVLYNNPGQAGIVLAEISNNGVVFKSCSKEEGQINSSQLLVAVNGITSQPPTHTLESYSTENSIVCSDLQIGLGEEGRLTSRQVDSRVGQYGPDSLLKKKPSDGSSCSERIYGIVARSVYACVVERSGGTASCSPYEPTHEQYVQCLTDLYRR